MRGKNYWAAGGERNVRIYFQISTDFLSCVLPALTVPCLFWLDAHFSSWHAPQVLAPEFPLPEELALIRSLKKNVDRDVILCDDMRTIADPSNPRYRPGECPRQQYQALGLEDLTSILSCTHSATLLTDREGVLAFVPRRAGAYFPNGHRLSD